MVVRPLKILTHLVGKKWDRSTKKLEVLIKVSRGIKEEKSYLC